MALAACRGIFSQSRIALFAAIADVSESSALARNYGAFGVAFGLCFVLGPGVGAVLYTASRRLPFVVSFALTLAAWALAFALPETLAGGAKRKAASWNPVAPVRAVCAAPLVAATLPSFVLASVATSTYALSVFLLTKRFGASTTVVGVFLSCVGLAICVCQGVVLPLMLKRLDDRRSCLVGFVAAGTYFLAFGLAPTLGFAFASVALVFFSGLFDPCMRAIMASVLEGDLGALSGALASLSSASHISSFAFGALFVAAGSGAPFVVASGLCFVAGALAWRAFRRHPAVAAAAVELPRRKEANLV